MKWEHKIGIAITCTFLCLVGAVIGLKMREQTNPQPSSIATTNPHEMGMPPLSGLDSTPPQKLTPKPPPGPPLPNSSGSNRRQSGIDAASLAKNDPMLDPTESAENGPSIPSSNLGAGNNKKPVEPAKEKESSPPLTTTGLMSPDLFGSANSDERMKKAKPAPVQPPLKEASQSGQSSPDKSETGKNKSAPVVAQKDPNKVEPEVLPLPKEIKESQSVQNPSPAPITQTGGNGSILSLNSGPLPPPSPPKPTSPGNGPSPTSAPSIKPPASAPSSGPNISSVFPDQSLNSQNTTDLKTNCTTPPPPAPLPVKPPEMSKLAPTPAAPPSGFMPSTVSAAPVQPPTTTTPPPSAPIVMPTNPTAAPSPPSSPAPVAPSAPPSPPKPPADGSTFIRDGSSSAPGPVGVKPAPLPLPTPPSSPLATTPANPTPPQPASNGPSVMVYDEQDYSCQSGDTWEAISKHFYMTDRYAKALQRHNQNHARASERMRDTGQPAPGERIFVPQAHILEARYADAVPKPAAAPTPATMPAGYVPNGSPSPPRPNP